METASCDPIWFEDIKPFLKSVQVVPLPSMCVSEQLNAITRLVLIVFVLLVLLNFPYSMIFLVISLLSILFFYLIQRRQRMQRMPSKENFDHLTWRDASLFKSNSVDKCTNKAIQGAVPYDVSKLTMTSESTLGGQRVRDTRIVTPQTVRMCNDEVSIDPPRMFATSLNQNLTTGLTGIPTVNPKTLISPVTVPPIYDLDYWKANNLVRFSQINTDGPQLDMYLSGYAESECCGYLDSGAELVPECGPGQDSRQGSREGYCGSPQIVSPRPMVDVPRVPTVPVRGSREGYCGSPQIVSPRPMVDVPRIPTVPVQGYARENYSAPRPNQSGWINTACGYNPSQVEVGLPSNYPAGNCEQSPHMKRFNENLFTSIVTPGVYTRTQVDEPINANIGISFQQQFEPLTSERDENGLMYTQHDPRIIEAPEVKWVPEPQKATYDNVYDPRFSGYGTSYRSYFEPVTGQTRFMYDDVNAIRMPNYIVRSKIDHLPYADSYGPIQEGSEFGNVHNPNIRALAQDSFLRDSLQFRDDITERAMRKNNAIAWQRRQAPLGQNQVVHSGGMSK